jgi:hypothetical protein
MTDQELAVTTLRSAGRLAHSNFDDPLFRRAGRNLHDRADDAPNRRSAHRDRFWMAGILGVAATPRVQRLGRFKCLHGVCFRVRRKWR